MLVALDSDRQNVGEEVQEEGGGEPDISHDGDTFSPEVEARGDAVVPSSTSPSLETKLPRNAVISTTP